jgi:hypothetical protein
VVNDCNELKSEGEISEQCPIARLVVGRAFGEIDVQA